MPEKFDKAVDILIAAITAGLYIDEDNEGQIIVYTNLKDVGAGGESRFVPLGGSDD